jgi:hypothetical protein
MMPWGSWFPKIDDLISTPPCPLECLSSNSIGGGRGCTQSSSLYGSSSDTWNTVLMDTPTRIGWRIHLHLQRLRHRSHPLHDFKWINPSGKKLLISFGMLQVKILSFQKYLIPNQENVFNTFLVCKRFLSLLSNNQTFACKAISRLQTLNEKSRRWVHDFHYLTHKSPRLIAESQLERGRLDGVVIRCIMGKLRM